MTAKKTLKEAAFCIGVHWRTLYQWTLQGKIAYIQFTENSPIFIPESEIERICQKKVAPK